MTEEMEQKKTLLNPDEITKVDAGSQSLSLVNTTLAMEKLHEQTSRALQDYDLLNAGREGAHGLHEIWEECLKYTDTSELILHNLRQFQVLLQKIHEGYYSGSKSRMKRMDDLRDGIGTPEGLQKYLDAISEDRSASVTEIGMIDKIGRTIIAFAKEQRESAMAKRTAIHVTIVEKLALTFIGILHTHIHDQKLLKEVSDELDEAMRRVFPLSVTGE